jgi:hypothetical protein
MIIEWNSSRVTTSKMMERRSGASVRPATSHASRLTAANLRVSARAAPSRDDLSTPLLRPTVPSATVDDLRMPSPRPRMKIRLATPVAASASTAISPKVSQTRMSTSVTLTMFIPPPPS